MRGSIKKYFLFVLALSFIAGFWSKAFAQPKSGGKVVISSGVGTPRHFNPALVSGSATAMVGTQLFASPLRYDEKWNPQPYLAESWKISKDGLSVTLKLVKGATFHDGHPITSADVAFSVLTVKKYHPFKSMFAPVEKVDTPDLHTAVIRLSQPHPAILLAMSPALLPIIPKHIYGDGRDLKTHPANLDPVGSGPFRFVKYVPGKYIVMKRNDYFFLKGRPYLDEIVIRLSRDPSEQMIEMERQEAHLLPLFSNLDGLDRLSQSEQLVVTPRGHGGIGSINWLAFNLLRKPLDDKRVRQAIAYMIDPEFIAKYMNRGRSKRAISPISPYSPFYDDGVQTYDFDPAKARSLLDEAGYSVKSNGSRFSLILDHIPLIHSQQRDIALYIKRQLSKVGIDIHVRISKKFLEWANRIRNWDFDMTMDSVYNWGDPVIGVHRTYLSDNIQKGVLWSNTQNYRNNKVDELLNKAAQEMDESRRKKLYSEFQRILTEELPIVWINVLPFHTIYHKGLGNPPVSIWGVHSPLDELHWKKPPTMKYASTPVLGDESFPLKRIGVQAMNLIKKRGLHPALEVLKDSNQGFLDLEGSGLHILGFTRKGYVFLDNSGQMKPGMDIKGILDLEGKKLLPQLLDAAKGKNDGLFRSKGVWPHPKTHALGPLSSWCGMLTEEDVICTLKWDQ